MRASEDPWSGISPPTDSGKVNGLRVGDADAWPFYWMLDTDRRRILGLRYPRNEVEAPGKLPNLRGLDVEILRADDSEDILVFRLLDSNARGIFRRLCDDIIASSQSARSIQEALKVAVVRTWHWHRLLKGGADGRLSPEEQKGLIGEIRVLTGYLIPGAPVDQALESWTGPLGAPKDFEVGTMAIEAKARRGAATPEVRISSEQQLDDAGLGELFLHVVHLATPGSDDEGFSLNEIVDELRKIVQESDVSSLDLLEARLSAAGYRDTHDYGDSVWMELGTTVYRVAPDFPRIVSADVASGVVRLTYAIELKECEPFEVDGEVLTAAIGGVGGE